MCLATAVTVFGFGVPLRGSFLLLLGLTTLFILSTLGLGLLVSTLVQNQQQAMMGAVFAAMVPMIYLSGLIFPIDNMPPPIQLVTYAIPLRYYAEIIRGVFLRGSGIAVLWPEALTLLLMGLAILTASRAPVQEEAGLALRGGPGGAGCPPLAQSRPLAVVRCPSSVVRRPLSVAWCPLA